MHILVRGGGDMASGVVYRLHKAGFNVVVSELEHPRVVRRLVAFANAVFEGTTSVEDIPCKRVIDLPEIIDAFNEKIVPVVVDPDGQIIEALLPGVLIDGRMLKRPPEYQLDSTSFVIGLGPGFTVGIDCHAAIETNRGHYLGRVVSNGSPQEDTGIPEGVLNKRNERVLRAPIEGELITTAEICDHVEGGDVIARINDQEVKAPFSGVLRGLMHPGINVHKGEKIGDIDPRDDPSFCRMISDKSLAVGGGVLEAILSISDFCLNL